MNDTIPALDQFIEPSPVAFSPTAPGWYVLGAILLLLLLGVVFVFWNNYRKNRYRRIAVGWLEREEKEYLANQRYNELVYRANMLAKQISIYRSGNNLSAPLQGAEWLGYLSKTCSSVSFSKEDENILSKLYQTNESVSEQQAIAFTGKITQWIKKHRIKP